MGDAESMDWMSGAPSPGDRSPSPRVDLGSFGSPERDVSRLVSSRASTPPSDVRLDEDSKQHYSLAAVAVVSSAQFQLYRRRRRRRRRRCCCCCCCCTTLPQYFKEHRPQRLS